MELDIKIKILLIVQDINIIDINVMSITRYNILSYLIYKYLSKYKDIDINIKKCFTCGNNYNTDIYSYNLPESDFIIIVDDRHFINRHMDYIDYYRKNNKYLILTLNDNNFFNVCEDIALYLNPICDIDKKNTLYIDYGYDNIFETININNYTNSYYIIMDTNIDYLFLAELSLNNIILYANKLIFIEEIIINKFNIITYTNESELQTMITDNKNNTNNYNKYCQYNGILWENNINKIYNIIKNNYIPTINNTNTTNIINKDINNIINKDINKKKVLIQSHIRN
jgi:hypothetical protein